MARKALINFRRDTAANWTSTNPILASGEPGFETDTGKVKIGDGSTHWTSLGYLTGSGGSSPLTTKGDLYTHDSSADARLPVGANNTVLTADSAQTDGIKWVQVGEAMIALSDVTTDNVSSAAHGFAPKSPADATKFLHGAATPAYAQVKDSDLSTSDITTNDVSTTKHGFTPKAPNDTAKFLRGDATWAAPAAATGTGLNLLFDSTLGADAASIDTGAGGIPAGHKDLFIVITARSAAAVVLATLNVVINNDTAGNYDRETWRGRGTAVSAAGAIAAAAIQLNVPGDSNAASHFASELALCPAYDVSGGPDKTYISFGGWADTTIANNDAHGNIATWRSTAAITRMAISDSTGANLRAGSRLCIYGTQ